MGLSWKILNFLNQGGTFGKNSKESAVCNVGSVDFTFLSENGFIFSFHLLEA